MSSGEWKKEESGAAALAIRHAVGGGAGSGRQVCAEVHHHHRWLSIWPSNAQRVTTTTTYFVVYFYLFLFSPPALSLCKSNWIMHRANSLSSLNIEASKQALPTDMVSTQKRTFAFADAAYGDGRLLLPSETLNSITLRKYLLMSSSTLPPVRSYFNKQSCPCHSLVCVPHLWPHSFFSCQLFFHSCQFISALFQFRFAFHSFYLPKAESVRLVGLFFTHISHLHLSIDALPYDMTN